MKPHRRKKLGIILFIAAGLSVAVGFTAFALKQNINMFYTPTQVAEGEVGAGHGVHAAGAPGRAGPRHHRVRPRREGGWEGPFHFVRHPALVTTWDLVAKGKTPTWAWPRWLPRGWRFQGVKRPQGPTALAGTHVCVLGINARSPLPRHGPAVAGFRTRRWARTLPRRVRCVGYRSPSCQRFGCDKRKLTLTPVYMCVCVILITI